MLRTLEEVLAAAKRTGVCTMAVAVAQDEDVLAAVYKAVEAGIVKPILVGDKAEILKIAGKAGIPVTEESILDETDSGLDIDALRIVAEGVNKLKTPENSTIVITHYQRLLDYIKPDVVHVLYKGRIVKTAGPELALELEEKGYDWIKKELGE